MSMALSSPMEEITMNAKLVEGYARKIKQLGGLEDSGKAIIREVQMVGTADVWVCTVFCKCCMKVVCVSVGVTCMYMYYLVWCVCLCVRVCVHV